MSTPTQSPSSLFYPAEGFGAPKNRHGHAPKDGLAGLPPGTEIFSADNHISVAEDIFYERFPEELKGAAPRIWYEDGAYMVGMKGKAWTGGDFGRVLMQYDDLAGAATNNIDARIRQLKEDGIDKELAFPNAVLALFHYPDKDDDGNIYDYGSTDMDAVWDEIEAAGLPVSHHIGETPPKTPCQNNSVVVGMMVNVDSFREQFAKYVFSGILDRHPSLKIGWFEGGIAWVPTALQDAEHMLASYRHMFNHQLQHDVRHYWDNHMSASFMVDPLGLALIDRIGVDNVMWSSDYPHNESTFGYSEKSLASVVEAVGAEDAVKIVSTNIKRFLGLPLDAS